MFSMFSEHSLRDKTGSRFLFHDITWVVAACKASIFACSRDLVRCPSLQRAVRREFCCQSYGWQHVTQAVAVRSARALHSSLALRLATLPRPTEGLSREQYRPWLGSSSFHVGTCLSGRQQEVRFRIPAHLGRLPS